MLDEVGSDELIVVGCSVGGSCALEVAFAAPEQVAAIVLIGAKADVNPDPSLRDAAIRVLETQGMVAAWRNYWLPLFAFHLVPDCGHYVNLEQPSMFEELLAEAIRPIVEGS